MPNVGFWAITAVLSLQTLITCLTSTIGQYVYKVYLETFPNATNFTINDIYDVSYNSAGYYKETVTCSTRNISRDSDANAWAQQNSADLFFWTNLVSSFPLIIMTYVLGLYTPKIGKRIVLIIPMLGSLIQIALWLVLIYVNQSDILWYIAAFLNGLSGAGSLSALTFTLIITENTLESERSSRFVRVSALQTALSALATFGIGFYITWRGFNDLYWCALVLQILSIISVFIFLKNVDNTIDERTPLLSSPPSASPNDEFRELEPTACSHFLKVFTVLYPSQRSKKKTISLHLTLGAYLFYILAIACLSPLLLYLLNAPFCWTSEDIGKFSALSAISSAVLSLAGMQLLTYFKASDTTICAISHVFFGAASLWVAFAKYDWQLYVSLIINPFSSFQGSLTTSMMSKWLHPNEQNYAFTLITETSTIITTFGNAFFSWLYSRTVVHHRNLLLFISAGISIIPFILNIVLLIINRKMPDEEEISIAPDVKESVPLQLESDAMPHAGDMGRLIIPSRSLTVSVHEKLVKRSRNNPRDDNPTEETANA